MIQDVVGVGGMGSVYRARDMHFPNVVKLVAVKEMINQAPDPVVRKTIITNFEREANILVTLNHPSIPKIFDFFSYDERSYLVEEFVPGKDMDVILTETEGMIPEDQVISWSIEICDVLQYLHNHQPEPIIFRDIKPSNIMVNNQGHVILVDFGIAKMFRVGQKGTMIGTEGYSPPEQYRGEATHLADIYALGATMHHLLTHHDPRLEPPFSFNERVIREINPAISVELETIVQTALKYEPEERFQSAALMKEALLSLAKKTGILSRINLPSAQESTKSVKPLWVFRCEDEIRGPAAYENGIIYVGAYDNNLYAIDATNGEFRWKFPTEGGIVTKPAIYQDNVIVGSADGKLYSISTKTREAVWTHSVESPIRCSPKVIDGFVIFGADDGYLYGLDLLSNQRFFKIETGGAIRSSPYVNSESINFGNEQGEFYCVDFHGQVKWRYKAKKAVTSSPLISEGVVYFTSLDGTFYALDAKSGWVIWRHRMLKGSISSPCRVENLIIAGSADGFIYCLNANTAKEVWKFQANHQISGSPVVHNDSLYCGAADGVMYCLEYRTGRLRWKFPTDGPITCLPLVHNNVLYFGSADHLFYALMA